MQRTPREPARTEETRTRDADRAYFLRNPGLEYRERPSTDAEKAAFIESGRSCREEWAAGAERRYVTQVTQRGRGVPRGIRVIELVMCSEYVA